VSDERPDIVGQQEQVPVPEGAPAPAAEVAGEAPATVDEASPADGSAEAQRDEYLEALRRLKAEFDNYRKRAERDRQSAAAAAAREVVRDILPVMDNLERAVEALGAQGEAIVAGVEMVRGQLAGVLAGHGVAEIPAGHDTDFDPSVHEAVAQVPAPGRRAGTVVEVLEKGYTHAELVLRPTKVVVAAEGGGTEG
jgi:molecular chaperone GrpE